MQVRKTSVSLSPVSENRSLIKGVTVFRHHLLVSCRTVSSIVTPSHGSPRLWVHLGPAEESCLFHIPRSSFDRSEMP